MIDFIEEETNLDDTDFDDMDFDSVDYLSSLDYVLFVSELESSVE